MATYGYVRTSPPGKDGAGRAEQEATLRGTAQARGATLDRVFVDEGVPGWAPLKSRPAGSALLAALAPGDVVLVNDLHRLFRSASEMLAVTRAWERQGIGLVVADAGVEPINLRGAGSQFFGVATLAAAFERDVMADRPALVRRVQALETGQVSNNPPFGWRVVNGKMEADAEEQAAIRTMIKLRPTMSFRRIADAIFSQHGIRISHEGVRQVLADQESRLSSKGG